MTNVNKTTLKKLISLGFEPIARDYEKQDEETVEKIILYQKEEKILLLLPEKGEVIYTSPYLSTNIDNYELENLSQTLEYMKAFPEIMKSKPVAALTISDLPLITEEKKQIIGKDIHKNIMKYNFKYHLNRIPSRRIPNKKAMYLNNIEALETKRVEEKIEEEIYTLFQQLPQDIQGQLISKTNQKIKEKRY